MVENSMAVLEWAKWAHPGRPLPAAGAGVTPEWYDCVPLGSVRSTARIVPDPTCAGHFLALPWFPVTSLTGKTRSLPLPGGRAAAAGSA